MTDGPLSTDKRVCSIHKAPCDMWARCHRCHGDGSLPDYDDDDMSGLGRCTGVCPDCNGHGGYEECEFCMDEDQLL